MPDWNKEISFGKKKQPKAEAAEPKQSIWKKEIGGSKKPKDPDAVPFWKKEIGGKKKQAKPEAAPAPVAAAAEAAEPKVPFWKKEIGGSKKAKEPKQPKPADAVPFWKKEIGGKKKAKPEPAPVAQPVAEVVAPAPAPAEAPAPQPVADDYSWLTESLAPAREDEPVPAWPPRSEDAPVAAASPPPSEQPAPASAPPAPAQQAPAPQPVVAAPVVVAAAAVAAEPKVPFWKKELGRKKTPAAPVAAPDLEPKLPFWKKELSLGKPKAPKAEQPAKPKSDVPFWKRELSLGKPKGDPVAKAEKPAKPKSDVPFWKRELGKPKGEQAPKAEKAAKPKSDVPFWKRELGGGKTKAPKQQAAKPGAVAAAVEPRKKVEGTLVGLKVGASQLAAARIHNNGAPQLLQVAREPLDDGIVVGGELRDPDALAEALKRFFAKHKLPKKGVRLGIANNRIGVRTFEISGIDEPRQLANAIRFRAQETLPIPLEEAVLDWQVLRESTDANGVTTRRVLLVVAYRELVDRYVNACKKAGLRLDGIDLEAFAMLRALTIPGGADDQPVGAQVVVNVGHDRSTFAVTDGRTCEFTRVLAWGGQNLNVAIARALDATPSEAAPIKHALSLAHDTVAIEGFAPEKVAAVCAAARAELQVFARELVSSLRFYQNQPESLGIAELVLGGGTAALPGLDVEIGRMIGVAVRVGDPLQRLKLGKKTAHEAEPALAVAIGLGIED